MPDSRIGLTLEANARAPGKKYGLNVNSPTSQQVLDNLNTPVDSFISQFRQASIRSEMPSEFLGKTVGEALQSSEVAYRFKVCKMSETQWFSTRTRLACIVEPKGLRLHGLNLCISKY